MKITRREDGSYFIRMGDEDHYEVLEDKDIELVLPPESIMEIMQLEGKALIEAGGGMSAIMARAAGGPLSKIKPGTKFPYPTLPDTLINPDNL